MSDSDLSISGIPTDFGSIGSDDFDSDEEEEDLNQDPNKMFQEKTLVASETLDDGGRCVLDIPKNTIADEYCINKGEGFALNDDELTEINSFLVDDDSKTEETYQQTKRQKKPACHEKLNTIIDSDDDKNEGSDGADGYNDIDTIPFTEDSLPQSASYETTESIIALKMSKLSVKEREEIYYDIHGVSDVIDEDSEEGFLDRKLEEMEKELQNLIQTDCFSTKIDGDKCETNAYKKALSSSASYVQDRDFRLRFLRADRFNTKLAAERYIRHFEQKLKLFGEEKLGRDIIQDDLGDEALDAMYSGVSQILPERDNAGRTVVVWISKQQSHVYSTDALIRRMFYNSMIVSDDVETQRKGCVFVCYSLNQQQKVFEGKRGKVIDNVRSIVGATRWFPVMYYSFHFCYNNYVWLPVLSLSQMSSHLFVQLRFRAHYGSHMECIHKLFTFGIPADKIPIDEHGNIDTGNHRRFLVKRREQERKEANAAGKDYKISVPSRYDVLLGRGKGYFNHVGNVRYRALIEDLKGTYDKAKRNTKQRIAKEVVEIVRQGGGRFLKDDGGAWVIIDNDAACTKVGHSFRALRVAARNMNVAAANHNNYNTTPKTNKKQIGDTTIVVATAPKLKRMERD